MSTRKDMGDQIRREARQAGLRDFRKPSIEAVERRRLQLWGVVLTVLLLIALIAAVLAWYQNVEPNSFLKPNVLRASIILLAIGFSMYAVEKELHLRRLSRLLVDERVLNAALTNRLQMHSALTDAGKAVNSVLELDEVLNVILSSALQMVEGDEGSIMLLEGESDLRVAAVEGGSLKLDTQMPLTESFAKEVAESRKPRLITPGKDNDEILPGLTDVGDSVMCVPLVNRGQLLGVLNMVIENGRVFDEYDLHVLALFAEPVAAAITNARLYEAERAHVAELLELDRMKSQFVATVSHELRTPITSIRGAIAASRRQLSDEQRAELLDVVERQSNRLSTMVEEMFAAAQLERHGAVPLLRRIDLASLVRLVALDSQVAGRPVSVVAPEFCEVRADPEAMRRILSNLIENAHKYGETPIEVIVEPNDSDYVLLSVIDSGPGVAPADREKIFDRFYRAERTKTRPGLGLGLPIVRGLVEACGGTVWVEEGPNGGAAFRVSLRARPDQEQQQGVPEWVTSQKS